MRPYFTGTLPTDIPELAAVMRPEDIQEVEATGRDVVSALWDGYASSVPCLTARGKDGEILAIWGVVPGEGGSLEHGSIWLLGSIHLVRYKKFFFKTSKQLLPGLLDRYPLLSNYMDDRNKLHRVYLAALGAKFSEGIYYGEHHYSYFEFRR